MNIHENRGCLQIENGFVSSFKGNWRINVGKYGKIVKI